MNQKMNASSKGRMRDALYKGGIDDKACDSRAYLLIINRGGKDEWES